MQIKDKLASVWDKVKQVYEVRFKPFLNNKKVLPVLLAVLALVFIWWILPSKKEQAPQYNKDAIAAWASDDGKTIYYVFLDKNEQKWHPQMATSTAIYSTGSNTNLDLDAEDGVVFVVWENQNDNKQTMLMSSADYSQPQMQWQTQQAPFQLENALNTNPTIQVKNKNDAMAVWVGDYWKMYYSVWDGSKWSEAKLIPFDVFRYKINDLQLLELQDSNLPYTLAFIADGRLYIATFDGENWNIKSTGELAHAGFDGEVLKDGTVKLYYLDGNSKNAILTISPQGVQNVERFDVAETVNLPNAKLGRPEWVNKNNEFMIDKIIILVPAELNTTDEPAQTNE